MPDFCIFYTVLLTLISLPWLVQSSPLESLDMGNIWQILKRLQRLDSLKKNQNKVQITTEPMRPEAVDQKGFFSNVNFNDFANLLEKIKDNNLRESDQIETEGVVDLLGMLPKRHSKNKLRFIPNMPYTSNKEQDISEVTAENNEEPAMNINDYSKVFVILDPKALSKIQNNNDLHNVLSKLLNAQTSTKAPNKPRYKYKGFLVNEEELIARRRGEGESPNMSPEKKKSRGGGHTAVPFLNYRGDIYDHDKFEAKTFKK